MYIKAIKLKNYRNHQKLQADDFSKVNLITGPNAVGKTNLIEAILRFNGYNKQKENIIKFGESFAQVDLEIIKNGSTLDYHLTAQEINAKPKINKKQPLGPIPIIHFTPTEGSFFNGTPQDRRYFLDHGCSFTKKKYQKDLQEYMRILRQKNNLLKEGIKRPQLIGAFNQQLVDKAALIINQRLEFLSELKEPARQRYAQLTQKEVNLELFYKSNTNIQETTKSLWDQLKEREELEYIRGCCLVGPHRDDFSLTAEKVDMGEFGSQGEKKTGCIALKLAQIDLLKIRGIKPLLILDDALSELDPQRRQLLLNTINECEQTFITTTDVGDLDIDTDVKHLKLG